MGHYAGAYEYSLLLSRYSHSNNGKKAVLSRRRQEALLFHQPLLPPTGRHTGQTSPSLFFGGVSAEDGMKPLTTCPAEQLAPTMEGNTPPPGLGMRVEPPP